MSFGHSGLIDLSHSYGVESPLLPPDGPICLTVAGQRDRDGYLDFRVEFQEHSGTHLDAPLHFAEGGASVGDIPAQRLCGPLVILDISSRAARHPDAVVGVSDILDWERVHGVMPAGAVVVMRSDWSLRWPDQAAYFAVVDGQAGSSPAWDPQAAQFLLDERDVLGIGVDTCSIDPLGHDHYPVHELWLGAGRWAIENLTNLRLAPPCGATVIVGVPRMAGCTGFPARVIALT